MKLKVLVVDDSLFMRKLISDMLNSDADIEVVDTAKNGFEAIKKLQKVKPDVITLDLVMPGLDGFSTLKQIMAQFPTPVIMIAACSRKDADITLQCLNAGAISFILKPSGELSLDIEKVRDQLVKEVKIAVKVNLAKMRSLTEKKLAKPRSNLNFEEKIVVIGASTGGPQTVEVLLSSLPLAFPAPIIVVQHMPSRFFTQSLAKRLNNNCELEVKEAENNEVIQMRKVYLNPGGFRMTVEPQISQEVKNTVILLEKEHDECLSPSIDTVMKSVAAVYNKNSVGVILTGMGHDGVEGMKAIKENGGKTIVQDESSIIFGMPQAVIENGYADKVLPLAGISAALIEFLDT